MWNTETAPSSTIYIQQIVLSRLYVYQVQNSFEVRKTLDLLELGPGWESIL